MGRESQKRSPRRERSPARHKSSRRSRSPVGNSSSRREISPAREKHSSHAWSPKRAEPSSPRPRSPSPRTKRLRGAQAEREAEKVFDEELGKNVRREREKVRRVHSEREADNVIDKEYEKNGGREREKVRRDHDDREARKVIDKEYEKNSGREREKVRIGRGEREAEHLTDKEFEKNGREREKLRHREKNPDLQAQREIGERRSTRDDVGRESSRSRREHSSSPRNNRRRKHSASPANLHRHERSQSPSDRHHRSRHKSRSPPRTSKNGKQNEETDSEDAEAHGDDGSLAKMKAAEEALDAKKKQQPSFELSGKLAAETNRVRGITLLFSEPPEARKPDIRWRLYVFKGGEVLNEPLYIHRQSCYLFGRERRVADIPTDHPSCSKQHSVIQYRQVEKEQPDGMLKKEVRPYLMDLGSTNGTFINDNRIEPQRYYELFEKDTIKFGNSSREYVMLHENSMDE